MPVAPPAGRANWTLRLLADDLVELDVMDSVSQECVRITLKKKVVLVMDNLNTHKPAALYEAFEPALARSLLDRLEIHHTPKHGSWLNMAKIELSVLSRQCLDRRIPDLDTVTREVAAWEQARNANSRPVNWRFTTPDARIKLKRLYPSIQDG